LRNCDLAAEGSPTQHTLMSPRRLTRQDSVSVQTDGGVAEDGVERIKVEIKMAEGGKGGTGRVDEKGIRGKMLTWRRRGSSCAPHPSASAECRA
jgi:hypothetical protein